MASRKEYEMLFQLQAQLGSAFNSTFSSAQQQLASMQQEIQALNRTQSDISAYQKQQQAVEATKNKLEVLKQQYDNIQQEIKETEGFSSSLENKLLAKQQQIDKTSASLEKETDKLNQMDNALQEAGIDTSNLASESSALGAKIEELKQEQEQAAEAAEEFGESTAEAFSAVQEAITAAGIAAALKEIYEAYKECISIAAEFEETMSTVEALSGASASEMGILNDKAKELGATTKFTAIESGEAMTYMAMAGWDANQMLNGMDGVLQLAAASGEDLANVADIVTDNLTAFGLKASDTAHFSDVLAAAATSSNTSVSVMGETFKNSAALAGALGYSVEDVAVAIGLMANAGIKGSNAGTALKNVFNGLLSGITLTSEAFGEVEYSAINADGTMKSFGQTIEDLRGYFSQMTGAEQMANAETIAGQRAMAGFVSILNSTDDDFNNLTDSINNCAGAASKMAEIKMDNLNGQLTLMNSAADALKTTLGEQFSSELRGLAKIATEGLTILNSISKAFPGLTKGIIAFVAVLGAAAAGFAAYTAAMKVAIPLMTLFKASLPGGEILLAVTAGAALVGALVGLGEAAKHSANELNGLTASSREQYDEIQQLTAEYEKAVSVYGEHSQEALTLKGRLEALKQEYESTKQSVEEFNNELQSISDAIRDNNQSYNEAVSGVESEGSQVLALTARLKELADANDGSNASQTEMLAIIEDLNAELPGLNLNMESLVSNTEDVIAAIEERAMAEINAEKAEKAYASYKTQLEQKQKAEAARTKALEDQRAAQERLNDALNNDKYKQYLDICASIAETEQKTGHAVQWSSNEYRDEIDAVTKAQNALETANEEVERAQSVFDEASDAAQGLLNDYLEFSGVSVEAAESMGTIDGVLNEMTSSLETLAQAYDTAYQAALTSFEGQFGLFDEAKADLESTVASAQAALDSQLTFWQDYAANVAVLKQVSAEDLGVTQETYNELMAYAQSGSEEAAGFAKSMAEAINSGNVEAVQKLAKTVDAVRSAREQAAGEIASWQTDFDAKMNEIIQKAQKSVNDLDLSAEATAAGQKTINAYAEAIRTNQAQAVSAAKSLANAVKTAIESVHPVINVTVKKTGDLSGEYASGTDNAARGFALVGEKGPEIVYFGGGEQVIPADRSKQIMDDFKLMESLNTQSRISPEPVAAQSFDNRNISLSVAPVFNVTNNGDSRGFDDKLSRLADVVVSKVMDALDEAGIDAKRSVYA